MDKRYHTHVIWTQHAP